MPNEIKSAAKATEIASSLLKQYYAFVRPLSAVKENSTWVVKIDVGPLATKIAEVKIDALTGDVIGYSVPSS